MGKILTKSNIKFDEIKISRQTSLNPDTGQKETGWFVDLGYDIETLEGEGYKRNKQIELKGTKLTTAKDFFTTLANQIKTEEGI